MDLAVSGAIVRLVHAIIDYDIEAAVVSRCEANSDGDDREAKVPEGLSDDRVNESLRIPGVDEPTAGLYGGSFEAPRAEAALRTLTLPTIRRYQLGDFHWLSIPEAPSAVWPELE